MSRDTVHNILGALLVLGIVAVPIVVLIVSNHLKALKRSEVCSGLTVKRLGGCSKGGSCRVELSDGSFTFMDRPIEGEPCR